MGLAINNLAPAAEDRASGGQVIDGSLRFDSGNSTHLTRTPGSAGNRRTWTFSCWVKLGSLSQGERGTIFQSSGGPTIYQDSGLRFAHAWDPAGTDYIRETVALFRDPSAWYHVVWWCDTTQSGTRWKIYVNGVEQTLQTAPSNNGEPAQNTDLGINSTDEHTIGEFASYSYLDGYLSQAYFVDGQALDASYFGFTDPLTNTWRPKKYTGTYGTNGFYLPMDGNSPIGKDKSGNGNDWTPVNFRGAAALDKATGALPILNTVSGGRFATVGVRTDSLIGVGVTCELALPFAGNADDVSHLIDNKTTQKTTTVNGNLVYESTINRFYYYDGCYKSSGANSTNVTVGSVGDFNFLHDKTTPFTIEFWFDGDSVANSDAVFDTSDAGASNHGVFIGFSGGHLRFVISNGSTNEIFDPAVVHSTGQWYHYAVTFDGSRIRIFVDGIKKVDSTYSLSGSTSNHSGALTIFSTCVSVDQVFDGYMSDVRVYSGIAKYTEDFIVGSSGAVRDENIDILPDTPSGVAYSSKLTKITDGSVSFDNSGDSLTTPDHADFDIGTNSFTIECFAYLQTIGQFNNIFAVGEDTSDGYRLDISTSNNLRLLAHIGGSWSTVITGGTALVADKWYHLAVTRSGNNFDLWVDGIKDTTTVSNSGTITNPTTQLEIGRLTTNSLDRNYHGFISNLRFVNGSAVYTSPFTPPTSALTNVTNTKLLCCQSNADRTAAAVSPGTITGNGNAQANTFNPFTTDINAARGQESGYATLNPVSFRGNGSITDGNLTMAANSSGDCCAAVTLQIPTDKKIYLEAQHNVTAGAGNRAQIGVVNVNVDTGAMARPGDAAGGWAYDFSTSSGNSGAYDEGTRTAGPPVDNGDICMWCIDLSAGLMWAGKNGQWFSTGNPSTGSGAVITGIPDTATGLKVSVDGGSTNRSELIYNFGQKPFKYNPPDGFQPLCLANLPRPTSPAAVRPDKYFDIVTYSGSSDSTLTLSSLNFKPDLVWIKSRTNGSGGGVPGHIWTDSVRGAGTAFFSNNTAAQDTNSASGYLSTFNSNGFTLSDGSSSGQRVKHSTSTYAAWCWKGGGGSGSGGEFWIDGVQYASAAAAGLNGGTNTPSGASINTESGFSIITYTGDSVNGARTISHGLGKKPDFVIIRNQNSTNSGGDWIIGHKSLATNAFANSKFLKFTTDDTFTNAVVFGAEPTTTLLQITSDGDAGATNIMDNGNPFIIYSWCEVPGFSKFGSYTSNNNADGPFIHCGFRPALVWLKKTSATSNWFLYDTSRNTYNVVGNKLYADSGAAENGEDGGSTTSNTIDILSNGFKLRTNNGTNNGGSYIFCAWAEAPTNNLFGGQANAR